jgi:hypothetical protein
MKANVPDQRKFQTNGRMKTLVSGIILLALIPFASFSQDPHLPPGNLGLTNLQDGNPPSPGWYYLQYVQIDQPDKVKNGHGVIIDGAPRVSSLITLQQVVFISKKRFLGGNLGFTTILPLVKLSTNGTTGVAPSINPSPLGDLVTGPLVQWFNRKLFGMDYSHRLEVDVAVPTGGYHSTYDINPGARVWRVFPHYTFTLSPVKKLSFSMRHHLNYYFKGIGSDDRPGITYNFNYSAEYAVTRSIFVEAAGYYLNQLEQDAHSGDHNYFQRKYGITDTRERVFAYGPGVGFVFPSGLFLEVKAMKEAAVQNRSEGWRGTLALSYKLNKN